MARPPVRVSPFATGSVGSEMIERIVAHPDLAQILSVVATTGMGRSSNGGGR